LAQKRLWRVLVVAGRRGTGKSAVLGRIVEPRTPTRRSAFPRPIRGSGDGRICELRGAREEQRRPLEIATEIARAASAALPVRIEEFAPALRAALRRREEDGAAHDVPARQYRRRFVVIIDGLTKPASLAEARAIVRHVVLGWPAWPGRGLFVGSRHAGGDGDLLDAFGGAVAQIDLDSANSSRNRISPRTRRRRCKLVGDERPGNPYTDQTVAGPVAAQIAAKSRGNFLVAGLTARRMGARRGSPRPAGLSFSAEVAPRCASTCGAFPQVRVVSPRRRP